MTLYTFEPKAKKWIAIVGMRSNRRKVGDECNGESKKSQKMREMYTCVCKKRKRKCGRL